jgi:hypothetical protein
MPSSQPRAALVEKYGRSGPAIIDAVLLKRKCATSNYWREGDGGDFDKHVAALQVRAAILNRFTRLGTPTTVATP